jgi:ABC-type amino acid transport system permease subunit
VWPALVSQIIIVMLGSAVCGQISTEELSYAANLIQSRNFRAFEAFIVAAALYLRWRCAAPRAQCWAGAGWEVPMVEFTVWDICATCCWPRAGRWACRWWPSSAAACWGWLLLWRQRPGRAPRRLVATYVQLFQGTPLLMQLFLAYFGMA